MRTNNLYTSRIERHFVVVLLTFLQLWTGGCSDELAQTDLTANGDYPAVGSEVAFAVAWPSAATTRAVGDLPASYQKINQIEGLEITMKGEGDDAYTATASYNVTESGWNVVEQNAPLRWQDNVKAYSFTAKFGVDNLATEQTEENWARQDLLKGYGAVPTFSSESGTYTIASQAEFKTSKLWYTANKTWRGEEATSEECRTIPIFLQHQRAWITIILKAGEGVARQDLDPGTAKQHIAARCLSYKEGEDPQQITPKQGTAKVSYEKDANGEAETDRPTVQYDAIVEPHDFTQSPNDDKVFTISLSGQTFLFFASNDEEYNNSPSRYNLQAGKHLTITATLSRESRKVMMTAYLEDWEEEVNSFVCDDFGGNGSPVVIYNQNDLYNFLTGDKNKAGNVGIINVQGNVLHLDDYWDPRTLELKSTLNLGGCTITSSKSLLNKVASTGSVAGGTIALTANVESAVALTNDGTLERLTVIPHAEGVIATRAGLAVNNHGLITKCTSSLPVRGTGDTQTYIGGIAAESWSKGSEKAYIQECTVTAKVDIAENATNLYGAGIVGLAGGVVSNNTYEYGVTMHQLQKIMGTEVALRNIIHTQKTGDATLVAQGNSWPTTTSNEIAGQNANPLRFDYTIDCEKELKELVEASSSNNAKEKRIRISNDFEVKGDTWGFTEKSDNLTHDQAKNLLFTLEGNGKTITLVKGEMSYTVEKKETNGSTTSTTSEEKTVTAAPMLFCNITGTVQNLTIHLKEDLGGWSNGTATDVAAPLAYSLAGGTLNNVKVTAEEGAVVKAAGAAGLVVWAYNNAQFIQCSSKAKVELQVDKDEYDKTGYRYAGGLVSQVDNAKFERCSYSGSISCSYTSESGHLFFIGGLVGCVEIKTADGQDVEGDQKAQLILTDSYSRFQPESELSTKYIVGSVLGRSYCIVSNQPTHGVVSDQCQGNWWIQTTDAVGGKTPDYSTDEKILGKRNAVDPAEE